MISIKVVFETVQITQAKQFSTSEICKQNFEGCQLLLMFGEEIINLEMQATSVKSRENHMMIK